MGLTLKGVCVCVCEPSNHKVQVYIDFVAETAAVCIVGSAGAL